MQGKISKEIAVFVGPTAFETGDQLKDMNLERFAFFPPIKRGDLPALSNEYKTIVIVDGFFGYYPAVGHIEIRNALKSAEVYGCSSMGAIRAYEMRDYGMKGYGKTYEMFYSFDDFTDAELALFMEPVPPFRPITEPLVHFRYFIQQQVTAGAFTGETGSSIMAALENRYYGDLTMGLFFDTLCKFFDRAFADSLLIEFPEYRIKTIDYLNLLKHLSIA